VCPADLSIPVSIPLTQNFRSKRKSNDTTVPVSKSRDGGARNVFVLNCPFCDNKISNVHRHEAAFKQSSVLKQCNFVLLNASSAMVSGFTLVASFKLLHDHGAFFPMSLGRVGFCTEAGDSSMCDESQIDGPRLDALG